MWIRPSYEACVCFSCFGPCHNLSSYHTNEEQWTNTTRTGFQNSCPTAGAIHTQEEYNQPQRYTTAASRASPTSCLCDSHRDYVCVLFVCTECTAVLIYVYAWVGGWINADRCSSARLYTARSSVEHAANRSWGERSAFSASFISATSISTGISIATALYRVHIRVRVRVICTSMNFDIRFLRAVPFIRTYLYICCRYPSLLSL